MFIMDKLIKHTRHRKQSVKIPLNPYSHQEKKSLLNSCLSNMTLLFLSILLLQSPELQLQLGSFNFVNQITITRVGRLRV